VITCIVCGVIAAGLLLAASHRDSKTAKRTEEPK